MGEMLKQLIAGMREHDPTPLVRAVMRVIAGAALALFAILLYAPALGDTRFLFGTDTVSHDYIMHMYGWVKSIGERGELPLWNPYMFSGTPMIGSAALCPFYPSQWLYAILPFNAGYTIQYALAIAVGGIGAAWWMRCLGHRRSISFWAGFIFMVSGHFLTLTHAGHLQKMIAIGWTPVALGATIQLVRFGRGGVRHSRRYKAAALLGLALGMQLLASHPQIFYGTAAACVFQLIGMAATSVKWKAMLPGAGTEKSLSPGKALRPVGRAIAMSILALIVCAAISAVQLFPSLQMAGLSNRADGVSFAEAVETSYPPLEVLEYAIPSVFGDSVRGSEMPYFGAWGERIVSDYVGLPVLFLALVGLFGSRRRYRWFLLILFFVGLLTGFGSYTPLYWLLYHTLPGLDGFRSPGTFMFLSNCAIVGLAAFGLDYLVSLADTVNDRGWDSSFSDDEAAAEPEAQHSAFRGADKQKAASADDTQPFDVGSLAHSETDTPPHNVSIDYDELEDDPGLYYYPDASSANVSSSNFTWDNDNVPWLGRPVVLVFLAAMAVTALVGAIIALAENWGVNLEIATEAELLSHHTYSRVAGAAIAVMCVLAAILLLRLRSWVGGVALGLVAIAFPLVHNYHYLKFEPLTPYMAHLTRQPDLLNLAERSTQPIRLLEENALKNEAMLYNISSVAGYHPITSGAYATAANALGFGSEAFGGLFAVNHARTTSEDPPADGNWVPDEDATAPATGRQMWRRETPIPYVRNMATLVTMELLDMPLTSASMQAIAAPGGEQYVARVAQEDAEQFRLVEGPQRAEARLQQWLPHEVRLRTNAIPARERAGVLLPVSDPYFPGWHAETSTGINLPVVAVNGVQRGVVLPPGEHNIRFIFAPYAFRLGLFISLVSATLLMFFGIGTITRRVIKGKKKVKKVIKRAQTGQHATVQASAEAEG